MVVAIESCSTSTSVVAAVAVAVAVDAVAAAVVVETVEAGTVVVAVASYAGVEVDAVVVDSGLQRPGCCHSSGRGRQVLVAVRGRRQDSALPFLGLYSAWRLPSLASRTCS